jgi:TetR/AcrR family transcriptional regulator, cholesterol catabolism regulator
MADAAEPTETTRERILRAAASLFRQQGYHGTSLHAISQQVGITKSSLYHHFPSKQALLSAILEFTVERMTPQLEEVVEADLPASVRLSEATRLHILATVADQDSVACFIEEGRFLEPEFSATHIAKRDHYEGCFRRILQDGVDSGEFATSDVRLASLAIFGMSNWLARWYDPDGHRTPEEIAEEFGDYAVRLAGGHLPDRLARASVAVATGGVAV